MRYMLAYDFYESMRNTNQWLGATAKALGSYPATGLVPHPMFQVMAAWGQVTERTFSRMIVKPDWNVSIVVGDDGRDHVVSVQRELQRPFGDLVRFRVG